MSRNSAIILTAFLLFSFSAHAEDGSGGGSRLLLARSNPAAVGQEVRRIADSWTGGARVGRGVWRSSVESLEFELPLSGAVRYDANRLRDPERVYFDLEPARIGTEVAHVYEMTSGPVRRVRLSQFQEDVVRVVFDMKQNLSYEVRNRDAGLYVRLFAGRDTGSSTRTGPVAVPVNVPPPRKTFTVVVDPGHGGKDPGAVGRRGTREKDITLDIGRRLKRILDATDGVTVLLTRHRDVHLRLSDRTARANRADADLFVSVHVNAARNRRLNGIESWFLNATTNREWQEVADRENAIAKVDLDSSTDVDRILGDLNRSFRSEESMAVAHLLQQSMVRSVRKEAGKTHDHGVKWAKFQVLVGARMPAVLVEAGFISHPGDEKRLRSKAYREILAKAIAAGIMDYAPPQRVAGVGTKKELSAVK